MDVGGLQILNHYPGSYCAVSMASRGLEAEERSSGDEPSRYRYLGLVLLVGLRPRPGPCVVSGMVF